MFCVCESGKLDRVVYAFNLSIHEGEAGGSLFVATLFYRKKSRIVLATQKSCLKKKKKVISREICYLKAFYFEIFPYIQ